MGAGGIATEADTPAGDAFVRWLAKLLTAASRTGDYELFVRADGPVYFAAGELGRLAFDEVGGRIVVTRLLWEEAAGHSRRPLLIDEPGQKRWVT